MKPVFFLLSFWRKWLWTKSQIFQNCLCGLWMNRIFSFFHLTASLLKLVFEHFHWDEQESISETRLIVPERQAWSKKEPTHLDVKRILLSLARGLSAHKVTNHSYSFLCIFLSFCCCLSISSTLPGTFAQYVLIELRCQRMLSSKLHGWLSKG